MGRWGKRISAVQGTIRRKEVDGDSSVAGDVKVNTPERRPVMDEMREATPAISEER